MRAALDEAAEPEYVDPQMRPLLAAMRERARSRPSVSQVGVDEARARARADFAWWNAEPPPLERVEDLMIAGAFGPVRARLYDPVGGGSPKPGLVHFHGGGWTIGDLDLEDTALRTLARESGVAIFSVDYALAPEHPFPEPLEDCIQACRWLRAHARQWQVDAERLAIGGASAGANLALATALALRDAGEPWARFLLLQYGVYCADHDTESHRRFGRGDYGLDTAMMDFFWDTYLGDATPRTDPRAAPLYASLEGLPPSFLMAAGLDPLRDDSRQLAAKLAEAAVPHEHRVYAGVTHGFTLMGRALAVANVALREAGAALRAGLA